MEKTDKSEASTAPGNEGSAPEGVQTERLGASSEATPTPNESAHPPVEQVDQSEKAFGTWLKDLRLKQKISLEEIAAVTKVHILQLRALEENEKSRLPAPAFVRGFLVSYARHLGLDENEVLDRYKRSQGLTTSLSDQLMTRNARTRSEPASKVRIVNSPELKQAPSSKPADSAGPSALNAKNIMIGLGVIGVIVLIAALISLGQKNKGPQTPPTTAAAPSATGTHATVTTTEETTKAATPSTAVTGVTALPGKPVQSTPAPPVAVAPPAPAPTESKKPGAPQYTAEVRAIESNWVNVKVDDGSSKGMLLKAGGSYAVEAQRRVTFAFSDAGNVEIRWNGTWYAAPGSRGDVKTLTLPDQLASLTPKSATRPIAPRVVRPRPATPPPAAATPPASAPGAAAPAPGGATPPAAPPFE